GATLARIPRSGPATVARPLRLPIPAAPATRAPAMAAVAVAAMVAAAETEDLPDPSGVVVIRAELARKLRRTPAPIHAGELLGHSADFRAGETVYVTSRGADGGQSVVALGLAKIDAIALPDSEAPAIVVDDLHFLWRSAN